MNILLIGGTGIISSEICDLSILNGHNVVIINRGRRKSFLNEKAELIIADIHNESIDVLKEKIKGYRFDIVIDFISYNPNQLKKAIECFAYGCKQFFFISSATAYKEGVSKIISENCPLQNTLWKYAQDKADCELYLRNNVFPFSYTIIRPYVTYNKTRIPYQFCPSAYYTLINRILCGKPIPIYGENVKCTVTSSREFAVGVVGLYNNHKAFNEAFHITSDNTTSWEHIIYVLGNKLNKTIDLVSIPDKELLRGNKVLGWNVDEIIGDKGRNMVFNNEKIHDAVPDFKGSVTIDEGIDESLNYYLDNKKNQIIDYAWDARIDNLVTRVRGSSYKCNISSYNNKLSKNDIIKYIVNRYNSLYWTQKALLKIGIKLYQ